MSTQMQCGEQREVDVRACEKWNNTGILVSKGQMYTFRAEGEWIDGGIRCLADGFPIKRAPWYSRPLLRLFAPLRRLPNTQYFCLSGSIAEDPKRCFAIGSLLTNWVAQGDSGDLSCFANDVPIAYFNNAGVIRLTVTRLLA